MADIRSWLAQKGLGKHVDAFRANDIDFDVLASLGEDELRELGLSLGDRARLKLAIADLAQTPREPPASLPALATPLAPVAERRQLTVVFVDLVNSTALSRALDPEDLRDAMRAYHRAVAKAIRKAQGFVAKFLGDGVLAYFGYPHASEDAAERAVRASLRAVAAVKALPAARGHALVARAGVATGPVVVGDVMGEDIAREINVVGETPNLAARLLALGPPGAVIVAGSTRRLIGERFTLKELEPQVVKGIADPVPAFQVTTERQGLSRYEATRRADRSSFVGRSQEVGLLLDRWEQARAGDGQLVLVRGEAGIGKSRITETLWQSVGPDHHRVHYQCTPQHTNSPLYPAITQLAAVSGLQPEDEPVVRARRIREALPDVDAERVALVANLLGMPLPAGSPLENLTPARKRQLLLEAFSRQLEALCRQRPALWVVEDAHWIDPTTEELISQIVENAGTQRLLIVVTHRPDYRPAWSSNSIATSLEVNRLSRTHAAALIDGLAANKAVPAEVTNYVVSRADGVPLFMEELFKALCESDALQEEDTAYKLARPLNSTAIPATLQDSLMARLDRLGQGKAVAQIGAAIGRQFSQHLLASVANMEPKVLGEGLKKLCDAGLLYSRGPASETRYTFKHALMQDAAYASMLRERRQEVHGRIAQQLTERSSDARPELIAYHFEAATKLSEAVSWLDTAGDVAATASANQEAIRLWRRALDLIQDDDADSRRHKAKIKKKLAEALVQVEGYGSTTAIDLGESILETAESLKDIELYIGTCVSFWVPALCARMEFDRAEHQLARIAEDGLHGISPLAQTQFYCLRGCIHFHLGRFPQAGADLARAVALEHSIDQHDTTFAGGDVRIAARAYLVRQALLCGLPGKAMKLALETVELARTIDHPFSVSWALITLGRCLFYRGQFADTIAVYDESQEICMRYGYLARLSNCLFGRGIAMTALGEIEAGLEELDRGLELWTRTTGRLALDLMLVETAHTLMQRGTRDAARQYVSRAGKHFADVAERSGYAEYLRLDGLLLAADGDRAAAYRKLHEAIDVADLQTAYLFRLRACHDLARLLAEDGNLEKAHNLLAPAYAWFTEGFDTPDLIETKKFLDRIHYRDL